MAGNRQFLGFALLGLLALQRASGGASVTLVAEARTGSRGSSIVVPLVMANPTEATGSITTIQFDISFDGDAFSIPAIAGDVLRGAGRSLRTWDLSATRKRFLIFGMDGRSIDNGPLLTFLVNVRRNATPGAYSVELMNGLAVNSAGQSQPLDSTAIAITIHPDSPDNSAIQREGVLNSASLTTGSLAPGQAVTLLGSGIGSDSETATRVLFDDAPAPVLYESIDQINTVAPAAISGSTQTRLRVFRGANSLADLTIAVAPQSPGLFTAGSTGTGSAAALGQNGLAVSPSQPAERGSLVTLFATGLAASNGPFRFQLGDGEGDVLSAVPLPSTLDSVLQMSFRVPLTASTGLSVPLFLKSGMDATQSGVTLAVR